MNGSSKPDQAVERLLRTSPSISGVEPATTDVCLDAETLAAWMDGALPADTQQQAEAHVAGCLRCQALVGAFVRTEGRPDASAEAEGAGVGMRRWFGWLVPLTAAAAALVLWVMMPGERSRPETTSARVEPATVLEPSQPSYEMAARGTLAAPPNAAVLPPAAGAPPMESFDSRRTPSRQSASREAGAGAAADELRSLRDAAAPSAAQVAPTEPARADTRERQQQLKADTSAARDNAAAAAPPAPAPEVKLEESTAAKAVAAPPATPPPPPAAAPVAAPPAQPSTVVTLRRDAEAARSAGLVTGQIADVPTITTPDPRVRWRLMGSRVERTDDSGATWRAIYQQPTVTLTLGAAPSVNVCWIVGRAGAVIRTTDGRTFTKLPFPNTFHLVAVTATDAQNAVVRTVNGLTFATSDGGASWTER